MWGKESINDKPGNLREICDNSSHGLLFQAHLLRGLIALSQQRFDSNCWVLHLCESSRSCSIQTSLQSARVQLRTFGVRHDCGARLTEDGPGGWSYDAHKSRDSDTTPELGIERAGWRTQNKLAVFSTFCLFPVEVPLRHKVISVRMINIGQASTAESQTGRDMLLDLSIRCEVLYQLYCSSK